MSCFHVLFDYLVTAEATVAADSEFEARAIVEDKVREHYSGSPNMRSLRGHDLPLAYQGEMASTIEAMAMPEEGCDL